MKALLRIGALAAMLGVVFFARAAQAPPPAAEAGPTNIVFLNQAACLAMFIGIGQAGSCAGGPSLMNGNIDNLANAFGDKDGKLEFADFEGADLDGNQIHEEDGFAFVFAFVDDVGHTFIEVDNGGGTIVRPNGTPVGASDWLCQVEGGAYENCDPNSTTGDSVIIFGICSGNDHQLCGGAPDAGDRGTYTLSVRQDGFIHEQDYTIVGEPFRIDVSFFETTVSAGIEHVAGECPLAASVAGFTEALGRAEKTVAIATVYDNDDTAITGAWVLWETDDPDIGSFASAETPTLDLGSFGYGAPNIFCGTLGPGVVGTTMSIILGPSALAYDVDPDAGDDDVRADVTVLGVPENVTLSVDPPTVGCDGVASATVSALVTDEDGNNVANGTPVNWSVQVLGTANPLRSTTTDGVANTTVTPLAGVDSGVPVLVKIFQGPPTRFPIVDDDGIDNDGDNVIDEELEHDPDNPFPNPDFIEASTLVQCGPAAPPPGQPTPPTGQPGGGGQTPTGTIRPPDTGSAGALDGHGALSLWPAIGLALAGAALAGFRLAFVRTARR